MSQTVTAEVITEPVEVLDPRAAHAIRNQETVATLIADEAARIAVVDHESATIAAGFDSRAAAAYKAIEAERVSWVKPLNEQVDRLNGKFMPLLKSIKETRAIVAKRIAAWQDEERRRQEEAARIANELAEKERKRQEALAAENLRKAEEARQAEERARREAEEAIRAGDAAAAKVAQAAADKLAREAAAKEARAAEQEEKAATAPVFVAQAPAKVEGLATARPWKATCTNLEELLVAAVTHPDTAVRAIARGMLKVEFSQQAGNRQASATKSAVKVPGVVFAQETSVRQVGR